jgi:macrolide-specific efflux system membrane fusion protein
VRVSLGGGRTETRAVQVGVQGDQFVEITDGLNVGDQVAISTQEGTNTTTNNRGNLPGGGFGGGGFGGGGGGGGGGGTNGGR